MTLDKLELGPKDCWDHVAVDFEAYYDSEVTIKKLGTWHYLHHPDCEIYLVSIYDGHSLFVGPPQDFDWWSIAGRTWVSHNRSFDLAVYDRLAESDLAIVDPNCRPDFWHCTADMAVYLRAARDLKKASKILLDVDLSKDVRKLMKAKRYAEFENYTISDKGKLVPIPENFQGRDFKTSVHEYSAEDAIACWWLWAKHSRFWPPNGTEEVIQGDGGIYHLRSRDEDGTVTYPLDERRLSAMTTEQGHRGFLVDQELLEKYLEVLRIVKDEAKRELPWTTDETDEGVLSIKAFNEACAERQVTPPITTSEDSVVARQWEIDNPDIPWLRLMRNYRKANILEKRMQTIKSRIKPDGRFPYAMLYGGAHTLRWAGGSREAKGGIGETGFNVQNFNKEPMIVNEGYEIVEDRTYIEAALTDHPPEDFLIAIDLRRLVKAPPGKKIAIADLAQIEPRVLRWLIKDHETLVRMGKGESVYEIHANKTMGWRGKNLKKEDPYMQFIAKQRVLALGYACGWIKFQGRCAEFYVHLPDDEAKSIVADFRKKENKLRLYWNMHNYRFNETWNAWNNSGRGEDNRAHVVRLPNGRKLIYWMHAPSDAEGDEKRRKGEERLAKTDPEALRKRKAHFTHKNPISQNRAAYVSRDGSSKWQWFYGGLLTENEDQAISRDIMAQALINLEDAGHQIVFSVHDEAVLEVDEDVTEAEIVQAMCWRLPWAMDLPVAAECHIKDFYTK